jgi:hypothetical protein
MVKKWLNLQFVNGNLIYDDRKFDENKKLNL